MLLMLCAHIPFMQKGTPQCASHVRKKIFFEPWLALWAASGGASQPVTVILGVFVINNL